MTDLTGWDHPTIQVGIVADTHGYINPLVADVVTRCDVVVHAGDIGSQSVLDSITPDTGLLIAVAGNNDVAAKWAATEAHVVDGLPMEHSIELPGGILSVEHGHKVRDTRRYHETLRSRYPDSRAVIYGHTHVRVIDQETMPWVLNPGASGRERTRGEASCLVLEASNDNWTVDEHHFPN